MKNSPVLHHYVPRCLLKHFSNDNELFLLDKRSSSVQKSSIKTSFAEKHFYTIENDTTLESAYSELENAISPIIDKIVSTGTIGWLTNKDKHELMGFFIVQNQRTHLARCNIEKMLQNVVKREIKILENMKQLPEPQKELLDSYKKKNTNILDNINVEIEPNFIKYNIVSLLSDLPELVTIAIQNKVFCLIDNEKELFYIGDTPAVMYNQKKFSPYGNIGLAVPFIEMYLPLSPRYSLFIYYDNSNNPKFKDLSLIKAIEPNITFMNYLQIAWAHRFVVSKNNDFNFALKVLKEKTHIKDGSIYKITVD